MERVWMLAVCTSLVLQPQGCSSGGGLTGQHSLLLKHAVKTLLGFKDMPGSDGVLPSPSDMGAASRYMLNLYNRNKNGAITKGELSGNTVRSIHADIGELNSERVFLFNLSSIKSTEDVFSGELHFYKAKRNNQKTTLRMFIYEVAPTYMTQIKSTHVPSRAIGWQAVDVTSAVRSCLSSRREKPHLLAVAFIAEKSDGDVDTVSIRRFMKYLSMPFLIAYANETQTLTMDHMKPHFQPEGLSEVLTTGDNVIDKDETQTVSVSASDIYDDSKEASELLNRPKRSLLDNKIPEDPKEVPIFNVPHTIPDTRPHILKIKHQKYNKTPKEAYRPTSEDVERKREKVRTKVDTEEDSSSKELQLLPPPEFYENSRKEQLQHRRRQRQRHHRRRRKHRRRRLPLPRAWQKAQRNQDNLSTPRRGKTRQCGRRRLSVDFKDIGWGEWIISPKSFAAHYCSGECKFPLRKNNKPSNHAIIQSIVNAVGIHKGVPAPCCVPEVMSSVTLLYFDENQNVVLKNYPGMTVETCSCR